MVDSKCLLLAPKFRPLGLIFFPLPPILSKSPSSPRCPPLILSICLDFGCYVERWIEEIKERNKKKEEDKEAKASSFCGFFISTLLALICNEEAPTYPEKASNPSTNTPFSIAQCNFAPFSSNPCGPSSQFILLFSAPLQSTPPFPQIPPHISLHT
uniref:Uncharacterized protein n=1 Tax=Cucumis sativus TaxID=3659 RepID=A0A0A0KBY1_CUCSA